MLKFKKMPRAAYRDDRFQKWASRYDCTLYFCEFLEFRQGDSLAVVMPFRFHDKYLAEFEGMRPGLKFSGSCFRIQAVQLDVIDSTHTASLTPHQVQNTIRLLYELWLAEEAHELLKRTEAIGLHVHSKSIQRLKSRIEGVAA